jgi:CO/xanthine dehydrogenase FAD-binding subunit
MNIRRLPELRGISRESGTLRLGALTTITELHGDPLVAESAPLLSEAADHFASDQVRNMATVGGNICNASPAGDMLVPLIALGAEVELASGKGNRVVALEDFFIGPGRTVRQPHELLIAVKIPLPPPSHVARFAKFGTRPALDISTVSVAVAGVRRNGALSEVRVAFGAVAPTPVRGRATETVLEGRALNAATVASAARAAADEVKPISDVRATAWYRKEMLHNLTKRLLSHVANH